MKVYILIKVYGLVVDGVEPFATRPEAEVAFKKYTGMTEEELEAQTESEEGFKESYDQTQIVEVDVTWAQPLTEILTTEHAPCEICGRPGGLCSLLGGHLDTKKLKQIQNLEI